MDHEEDREEYLRLLEEACENGTVEQFLARRRKVWAPAPFLNVTVTTSVACSVLMCANVVGMFLHSEHFGWVRSAGSRGLAAFEEVVALHGVPSYIEVKGKSVNDKPQPIPAKLRNHRFSDSTVAIRINRPVEVQDRDFIICRSLCHTDESYMGYFDCAGGGTSTLEGIWGYNIKNLRLVVCDPSMTEVGDDDKRLQNMLRFDGCINAQTVELVGCEKVTKIRHALLFNYLCITGVDLSPLRNVTEIGMLFLADCPQLRSIDLSPLENVTCVGLKFMYSCEALTSVDLTPLKNLTTIGESFLRTCTSLTSIDLSPLEGITTLSNWLLAGCTGLTSVQLPRNITVIEDLVLGGCLSLPTIDLSPLVRVKTIGSRFMSGCRGLRTLDLAPLSNVGSLGGHFLEKNQSLKQLDVSPIEQVLRQARALEPRATLRGDGGYGDVASRVGDWSVYTFLDGVSPDTNVTPNKVTTKRKKK